MDSDRYGRRLYKGERSKVASKWGEMSKRGEHNEGIEQI